MRYGSRSGIEKWRLLGNSDPSTSAALWKKLLSGTRNIMDVKQYLLETSTPRSERPIPKPLWGRLGRYVIYPRIELCEQIDNLLYWSGDFSGRIELEALNDGIAEGVDEKDIVPITRGRLPRQYIRVCLDKGADSSSLNSRWVRESDRVSRHLDKT
jgi:hypothetical protein